MISSDSTNYGWHENFWIAQKSAENIFAGFAVPKISKYDVPRGSGEMVGRWAGGQAAAGGQAPRRRLPGGLNVGS